MVEQIDIMRSVDWRDPPGRLPTADDLVLARNYRIHATSKAKDEKRAPAIRQCRVRFDEGVIRPCQ